MAENTITTTRKGRFHLAKIIGTRYRFDLDEAWFHELAEEREPNRLWYERIPCQKESFIGVYSVNPLVFKLYSTRPKNAKKIHQAIKADPDLSRPILTLMVRRKSILPKKPCRPWRNWPEPGRKDNSPRSKKRHW